MTRPKVTSRSEFGGYSRKALAEFLERFAVPAFALSMSSTKMHEILSNLDRSARLKAALARNDAIDRHLKVLRNKLTAKQRLTTAEHNRFKALLQQHTQICRQLGRLIRSAPKQQP